MSDLIGTCSGCGKLRKLDRHGQVVGHYFAIAVSRRAVTTVGRGRVRRRCMGSGKPPRRPLGAER
jgi:hypothetical protein